MNFGFSHQKNKPDELGKLEQHIKHVWEISFCVLDHYDYHQHDLTNANIPLKVFSFIKQALIKFLHRLFLERIRKKTGKSVKHWCVTEKGHTNTRRIHLHGLFAAYRDWETKWQLTKLLYENWRDG